MLRSLLFSLLAFVLISGFAFAQEDDYPRNWDLDVLHYRFELKLSDETDVIEGKSTVDFQIAAEQKELLFNLFEKSGEKGMTISSLQIDGKEVDYTHEGSDLVAQTNGLAKDETHQLVVEYKGIPEDGLVISQNKYGERTFFGDNWPNRAHNWLVCVDHPSEKATVEFIVEAPDKYQVVATGLLMESYDGAEGYRVSHYKTEVPISPKVMVIGVAEFAVQFAGKTGCTHVTSWVYPENKEEGFYDYFQAVEVLNWFIEKIGEYPYEKLANVQSKTRFGGMENAGNIFYFEGSVTGNRKHEDLIAHEIAHQWFGNSATEQSWNHIWLSEGFATYLANVYLEEKYGEEKRQLRMAEERNEVTSYYKRKQWPVVNPPVKKLMQLLNDNSYQKGSWILHMLRHKLGDEVFWKSIRKYYEKYRDSIALTKDLQNVFEQESGQDLEAFFQQWLYTPGHPQLNASWERSGNTYSIVIQQRQDVPFTFDIELEGVLKGGEIIKLEKQRVSEKIHQFKFESEGELERLIPDPDVHLLFEMVD